MRSGIELFRSLTKIDLPDYAPEFASFTTAKRLEILPAYNVPSEQAAYASYLESRTFDPSFNASWHGILDRAKARGAAVSRVRIAPSSSSSYFDFEKVAYKDNCGRGERILTVAEADFRKRLGAEIPAVDFWLFDDTRIYFLSYDWRGSFLGVCRGDEQACADYRELFDDLFSTGTPIE